MAKNILQDRGPKMGRFLATMLLSLGLLNTTGCFGVDSDNEELKNEEEIVEPIPEPTPIPDPEPDPTPEYTGLSPLHTDGVKWVNAENETVILKGTNLGNWLLHEFWMMNQSSNTVATDQCTLEATFDERFGFEERERLMDLFRDNWISDRDWDIMQSFGINTIRLPFIWNLIEDELNPNNLREDAWQYLDLAIEKAEERGMYIILDLHGAVGAQGWNDHAGCAGKNEYWSTTEYQERTAWLWQEIAQRYKFNGTVAAYGLLNEPWGTNQNSMATEILKLHDAVREVDENKIVLLHGHHEGIDAFGHPDDFGGTNVAFEMHFYPGIFGWADPTYETHRDWLTCGESGKDGICAWGDKMESLQAPMLVGEFQPWQSLGYEFGGANTHATHDKFAELNWAATNWSYKIITGNGGQGSGTWGMVTNVENTMGLVAKGSTWDCAGWDNSFANSCVSGKETITPTISEEQTYYLVVKTGACCGGNLDVSIDSITLKDEDGKELVVNGEFGSDSGWTRWSAAEAVTFDFNNSDAAKMPTGSNGAVLNLTGGSDTNGGIFQAITLEGGKNYAFNGVFKDNGSANSWAEIYIVEDMPIDGVDVSGKDTVPAVDFANAPIADIEAIFQLYGSVEYQIHQPVKDALTATEPSPLYTLPAKPIDFAVIIDEQGAQLSWTANQEDDVTGYHVYRSQSNNLNYELIAENIDAITYTDATISNNSNYFYKVAAVDADDISYPSSEVEVGDNVIALPGTVEAENWAGMSGFEIEATEDVGGGNNISWADARDWVEYQIHVDTAGDYQVEYRMATESGSEGFNLSLNDSLIDSVVIDPTGGWQTWATQTNTVTLPEGTHTLKITAVGGAWNLNWLKFTLLD